jgi:hypothetical protein
MRANSPKIRSCALARRNPVGGRQLRPLSSRLSAHSEQSWRSWDRGPSRDHARLLARPSRSLDRYIDQEASPRGQTAGRFRQLAVLGLPGATRTRGTWPKPWCKRLPSPFCVPEWPLPRRESCRSGDGRVPRNPIPTIDATEPGDLRSSKRFVETVRRSLSTTPVAG